MRFPSFPFVPRSRYELLKRYYETEREFSKEFQLLANDYFDLLPERIQQRLLEAE